MGLRCRHWTMTLTPHTSGAGYGQGREGETAAALSGKMAWGTEKRERKAFGLSGSPLG